jgi:hypothetical protein
MTTKQTRQQLLLGSGQCADGRGTSTVERCYQAMSGKDTAGWKILSVCCSELQSV